MHALSGRGIRKSSSTPTCMHYAEPTELRIPFLEGLFCSDVVDDGGHGGGGGGGGVCVCVCVPSRIHILNHVGRWWGPWVVCLLCHCSHRTAGQEFLSDHFPYLYKEENNTYTRALL